MRKIEQKTMLLFVHYDEVAILKRPDKGLLSNLYSFPSLEGHKTKKEILDYLKLKNYDVLKIISLDPTKHIFTHIEWHMIGYIIFLSDNNPDNEYIWANDKELKEVYPLPTAFLKYRKELYEVINKKRRD